MKHNSILALLLISAAIAVAGLLDLGLGVRYLYLATEAGYLLAVVALFVAWRRGGVRSFVFWMTLIVAYPVLTPLITEALGYSYFSARAQEYQQPAIVQWTIIYASLSCLFISIALTSHVQSTVKDEPIPWRLEGSTALFFVGLLGMIFFAWLAEPGGVILSSDSYTELKGQRFEGAPFAGGAWVVFSALAISQYVPLMRSSIRRNKRRIIKWSFVVVLFVVVIYLLAHARRSELTGMLVFLFIAFGHRISRKTLVVLTVLLAISLSLVGYLRALNEAPLESQLSKDFVQLPGGPGNVLIGLVVGHELMRKNQLSLHPGETYFGHLLRLPPKFLGLDRPPTAYDYVETGEPLQGGEFFLIEPLINFGPAGLVVFLWCFAALANMSIKSVARYWQGRASISGFLFAGSFLILMFRTMWYGIGPLIKTMVIAFLVSVAIQLVFKSYSAAARNRHRDTLPAGNISHLEN